MRVNYVIHYHINNGCEGDTRYKDTDFPETEQEFKNRIIMACYGKADVKVGDWVYYAHKVNLGTKKYPYMIDKVEYDQVMSIGDKVCTMRCGDKPYHESIIAVYTGVQ